MITQTSGIPVRAVGQQELVPARLTQRSLGGIGNLRFTAEQSGTNFSSRVGASSAKTLDSLRFMAMNFSSRVGPPHLETLDHLRFITEQSGTTCSSSVDTPLLGTTSNSQFTAEQRSGTNFSSRVGMIASGICSSLAKLGDILKSCFVGSPSD